MIGVVSASTRPGRLSHNVAKMLVDQLKAKDIEAMVIDLMVSNPPNYAQRITEYPPESELGILATSIDQCKGLIWVSPEYNGGYTGALKNLIDISPKSFFQNKPIGISSVSSGGLAGMRGALQMQHLALATFGIASPAMLLVSQVQNKFDDSGALTDDDFGVAVNRFLESYLWLYEKLT